MDKKIYISLAAAVFLTACGAAEEPSAAPLSEYISETEITETPAETTSVSFTFARAEEAAVTFSETAAAETEMTAPLKENQAEYSDENISVIAEFLGVDEIQYYPLAELPSDRRGSDHVLHIRFIIKNKSKRCFEFFPRNSVMYGSHLEKRGYMVVNAYTDRGLIASKGYYTVPPGKSASYYADYVGDSIVAEYPSELRMTYYSYDDNADKSYNVKTEEQISFKKRTELKRAVRSAMESKKIPEPFVREEGKYTVTTQKNSYSFSIEPVLNGEYAKLILSVRCLTGKPEIFLPYEFEICGQAETFRIAEEAYIWKYDPYLSDRAPKPCEIDIPCEGDLYRSTWHLYVGNDGTAEYTMYFRIFYDPECYHIFSYDGDNDAFEVPIKLW